MLPPPMTMAVSTPSVLHLLDVARDLHRDGRIDAVLLLAHQGFAGKLQENALVGRLGHSRRYSEFVGGVIGPVNPVTGIGQSLCSPTLKRANRLTVMFSPVLADACAIICEMLTLGSRTLGWSISTVCE